MNKNTLATRIPQIYGIGVIRARKRRPAPTWAGLRPTSAR